MFRANPGNGRLTTDLGSVCMGEGQEGISKSASYVIGRIHDLILLRNIEFPKRVRPKGLVD